MKKNYNKKKFLLMVLLLFVVGLGIGYAILTEQLSINNTINYGTMKWDVGFTEIVDLSQYNPPEDVILANVEISQDKKSLSVACDIGVRTDAVECDAMVKITNNSTFNVMLDSFESGSSLAYAATMGKYLDNQENVFCVTLSDCVPVEEGYVLKKGQSIYLVLEYKFYELTEDLLNENGVSFEFEIDMNWVEYDGIFTFTIGGITYEAEKGMTWKEWAESDYNTLCDEWLTTSSSGMLFNISGSLMFISLDDVYVLPDDLIEFNSNYYSYLCMSCGSSND